MDIYDIVVHIFSVAPHWDLRRAPEVCRLWRDVYFKEKMILGWRAFQAGCVYGIYRTPYFEFEALYLAALGGHYEIAKYFAPEKPNANEYLLDESYIDSMILRQCPTEIIKLIPEIHYGYCLLSAYQYGHVGFIKTLISDVTTQVENILAESWYAASILYKHYGNHEATKKYPDCTCIFGEEKNSDHCMFCYADKICSGEMKDSDEPLVYGHTMSTTHPLAINEFIYKVRGELGINLQNHIGTCISKESLEFVLEKIINRGASIDLSNDPLPEVAIAIHKLLLKMGNVSMVGVRREDVAGLLKHSMQGIEYALSIGLNVDSDNRNPPLITKG